MVRPNSTSIFREVDLHNAASLRRLMLGLEYYLTHTVLNPNATEITAMQKQENAVADLVLSRIRGQPKYPLLLEATLKLLDAKEADDGGVLEAARSFENLTRGEVLLFPASYVEEYAAAQQIFENRSPAGTSPVGEQALQQRVCSFKHF